MKQLSSQSIIGQQGINLVERIVLAMKYAWRPTPGFDVGIDGEIEICDPVTGAATNSIIKVQVKSTTQPFQAETLESFEFICDRRDLDYWLKGNAPVLLVVCRPGTDESYWVSIKDYFRDPAVLKTRKVVFNKKTNRFSSDSAGHLRTLAIPPDAGIYFSPLQKTEHLYTNLLKVSSFADHVYLAETRYRSPRDVWGEIDALKAKVGPEWMLKNKMMLSFYPLDEFPFNHVCDSGTCERFDANEWSDTDDEDKKREFVNLLNRALGQRMKLHGLRYHKDHEIFFFPPNRHLATRKIEYMSLTRKASREVFKQYRSKVDPHRKTYCRHSAFKGAFLRLDGNWFLEITPTYHFSKNGFDDHPFRDELLKGIKRLERNPAVVGQLLMWADLLKRPLENLFSQEYSFLRFGELQEVQLGVSIPDNAWYEAEDGLEKRTMSEQDNQPELFGL